jgi:hypothetical protein
VEQFNSSPKKSGVNRVVGFEPEKEEGLLAYFEDKFKTNSLEPQEKEKSLEQKSFIERINHEMRDFLAPYGVHSIEVSPENVHILDRSKFTEEDFKKISEEFNTVSGFYSARRQGVAIMKDYEDSKLSFFQTLIHELLHLQGFYSYQKSEPEAADLTLRKEGESESLNVRRSGFSIGTRDGKQLLFNDLDESVITELAIRFEKTYMAQWLELTTELRARDEFIERMASRDSVSLEEVGKVVARISRDKTSGYNWVSYPYHKERQQFNSLIDELYAKNEGDFESREEVFELFAKATLAGRLLPVARLIEKTFGKGSFRMIGENSADQRNQIGSA